MPPNGFEVREAHRDSCAPVVGDGHKYTAERPWETRKLTSPPARRQGEGEPVPSSSRLAPVDALVCHSGAGQNPAPRILRPNWIPDQVRNDGTGRASPHFMSCSELHPCPLPLGEEGVCQDPPCVPLSFWGGDHRRTTEESRRRAMIGTGTLRFAQSDREGGLGLRNGGCHCYYHGDRGEPPV